VGLECRRCLDPFARDTVGKQLVRATDSVGANLVEGDGRFSSADALHFFIIARLSAREARYWLKRAVGRRLIAEEEGEVQIEKLASATQLLNKLISFRRTRQKSDRVREPPAEYKPTNSDPFVGDES
jgi:four helix bundle protein